MSSFGFDEINSLMNLRGRNALAQMKITEVAVAHAIGDAVIGGLGAIIPGMGPVALAATMAAQIPVYQSMVMELGRLYCLPPDRYTTLCVLEGAALGSVGMLAAEFGVDFLTSIATDLVLEAGLGGLATMIPGLGIIIGASLDMAIAATMTWRVGIMTSIYFQNGHRWVGSRKETYKTAKKLTGRLSPRAKDRVNLDSIPAEVGQVSESQIETAVKLISMLRKMQPDATDGSLRETMTAQGLPPAPIEVALRRTKKT